MALLQKEITEQMSFQETELRLRNIDADGGEDNKTIILVSKWKDREKVTTEWEDA